MNPNIIEGIDITKQYEKKQALQQVSFSLQKGECLGIIGQSGSGKSTLAQIIMGLEKPDAGVVLYHGKPMISKKDKQQFYKNVQLVFQNAKEAFNPKMKIKKAIVAGRKNYKDCQFRYTVEELLAIVGLDTEIGERYIDTLSGGEAQRAAIARSLALDPEVIIFDEITSSLDRIHANRILQLLIEIQQQHQVSYLYISHDSMSIQKLTNRLLVLKEGYVVETGTTKEIQESSKNAYTRALLQKEWK